jgi:hypothetical protein
MTIVSNGVRFGGGVLLSPVVNVLYEFTAFTFQTANTIGNIGPTIGNCYSFYSNTGNTWLQSTEYFDVPSTWRGYQVWTVPQTASYRITAAGSRSGVITAFSGNATFANAHGRGAVVQGVFNLTQGQKLTLLVGQPSANTQQPSTYSAPGGGGGTFVALGNIASVGFANVAPLIVAGGGGAPGAWTGNTSIFPGGYGVTTRRGGNSAGNSNATITSNRVGAPGGINGFGGNTHVSISGTISVNGYDSGGGGGYYGNGRSWNGTTWTFNTVSGSSGFGGAGGSFANGAIGGTFSSATYPPPSTSSGGFGGGSGSGPIVGGAGGGWSGGGGGFALAGTAVDSGGGGGSYIDSNAISVSTSDGQYDLSGTFNGASITNLGTYNNAAGYISIVKI